VGGRFHQWDHPLATSAQCPTLEYLQARVRDLERSLSPWAFEIILTRNVAAARIERVLKDRPGRQSIDTASRTNED